jgi:hypothetical protein
MSDLAWIRHIPSSWEAKPLRVVAEYIVSNVDKLAADNELPVRLCNYTDVYNNEFITLGLDFMRATATDRNSMAAPGGWSAPRRWSVRILVPDRIPLGYIIE